MEYRNAKYNEFNTIDVEINHPEFGWIPCTLDENDADTQDLFAEVQANAEIEAYVEPVISDEEQALIDAQEAKQARKDAMRTGEDYNGYQVSFLSEDGNALMQVKHAFDLGLTETNIHFQNGTIMPITSDDFSDFALWFATKRNEFFL